MLPSSALCKTAPINEGSGNEKIFGSIPIKWSPSFLISVLVGPRSPFRTASCLSKLSFFFKRFLRRSLNTLLMGLFLGVRISFLLMAPCIYQVLISVKICAKSSVIWAIKSVIYTECCYCCCCCCSSACLLDSCCCYSSSAVASLLFVIVCRMASFSAGALNLIRVFSFSLFKRDMLLMTLSVLLCVAFTVLILLFSP